MEEERKVDFNESSADDSDSEDVEFDTRPLLSDSIYEKLNQIHPDILKNYDILKDDFGHTELTEEDENILKVVDLDRSDFNVVDAVNRLFPDPESLQNIDTILSTLKIELLSLNTQTDQLLSEFYKTDCTSLTEALSASHNSMNRLVETCETVSSQIRETANSAESVTADIRKLDAGKRQLSETLAHLNQFEQFIEGIEDIKKGLTQGDLQKVASTLSKTNFVVDTLRSFSYLNSIKEKLDEYDELLNKIRQTARDAFERVFIHRTKYGIISANCGDEKDAVCNLLDAIGEETQHEMTDRLINHILKEYVALFDKSQECAWIDKVERRYIWLKRSIVELNERWYGSKKGIQHFPENWHLAERLTDRFCCTTANELCEIMKERRSEINVKLLRLLIERTTAFETALDKTFRGESQGFVFRNAISGKLSQFFDIYVQSIDEGLNELIDKFSSELRSITFSPSPFYESDELQTDDEGQSTSISVIPSAADLFIFYRNCIQQTAKLVRINKESESKNGDIRLMLVSVFDKYLNDYRNRVLIQAGIGDLLKTDSTASRFGAISESLKQSTFSKVSDDQKDSGSPSSIIKICRVLSTCEYCIEMIDQLKLKIEQVFLIGDVKEKSFDYAKQEFNSLIDKCVHKLANVVYQAACGQWVVAMKKIHWQAIENVGDRTTHIDNLVSRLHNFIPLLRSELDSARRYFTQICLDLTTATLTTFTQTIATNCRPLTPAAAEQLLLDAHHLKGVLMNLPNLESNVQRKCPIELTKYVEEEMSQLEMTLKMVMSVHEPADAFVETFLCLMSKRNRSSSLLQRILDMKGVKKTEAQQVLELFKAREKGFDSENTFAD